VGRGKRLSTGNQIVDYVLGNWQLNGVFTWRNGQPFNVEDSNDAANTGAGRERAEVVGNIRNAPHTQAEWFNTSGYAFPALYTYGNGYTNDQQDQRWINLDSSVIRSLPIWREKPFQFRAEAFNLKPSDLWPAGQRCQQPEEFRADRHQPGKHEPAIAVQRQDRLLIEGLGAALDEAGRSARITEQTFYRWRRSMAV
jgi:hypothetical protein